MNLRNTVLSGLGVLVTLAMFGLPVQAQSADNPTLNDPKQNRSSSLGGPITPTQTDLFTGSSTLLLQPITLEQESSSSIFNVKPVRSSSNRPAAPFVDDPPRPSGVGIINVKTD